jgi:hypothetical protein
MRTLTNEQRQGWGITTTGRDASGGTAGIKNAGNGARGSERERLFCPAVVEAKIFGLGRSAAAAAEGRTPTVL